MQKDKSNEAQFWDGGHGHAFMDSNRSKKAIKQYQTAVKIDAQDKEGKQIFTLIWAESLWTWG